MPATRVSFMISVPSPILHLNFSKANVEEVLMVIDYAKPIIAKQQRGSLLVLSDVSDAKFNAEVGNRMKEFTAHNKPFVRASAVVGVTGLRKIMFDAINSFSGRNIRAFAAKDDAIKWLSSQ